MMTITYQVKSGIYVNLTNRCPCACDFCLRKNGPGIFGSSSLWLEREPSVEEVKSSLDAWNYSAVDEVVFCGYGEPTERLEDLLEIARYIRKIAPKVRIRVNTNGLADLINECATAESFRSLVDTISISLNTPDAAEYERICHPKFGAAAYPAMLKFAESCVVVVPEVVMTVVEEPVTSKADQLRCREICEKIGARLRVRPYETPGK